MIHKNHIRTVVSFILLIAGCGVNDLNEQGKFRIVIGESIDFVKVGDGGNVVISKLGQPDEIAMGDFAGYMYIYKKGFHSGITVTINSEQGEKVSAISIYAPYSGRTKEGLGIGSKHDDVIKILGEPAQSIELASIGNIMDYYYIGDNKFSVSYSDNIVESIVLSEK